MWPFSKRVEKRQDGTSYTDVVTRALVAAATGEEQGTAAGTAALETAASLYARCFSMATIAPASVNTAALTPAVLSNIAREMVTRGESMYKIRVAGERVRVYPVGSWDIRGADDPEQWQVRVDTSGPTSSSTTELIPYAGVLHFLWSFDSALPWVGVGPASRSALSGRLHGALEQHLAHEVSAPVGAIIPIPSSPETDDDDVDVLGDLRKDIRNLKGSVVLTETTSSAFGEGRAFAPQHDWRPQRIGADPPDSLIALRSESGRSVLAAAGVPPSLYEVGESAAGRREALRLFLHTGLAPAGEIIAQEIALKLEVDVSINFDRTYAADITSRSRALGQMVTAGMDLDEARRLAGLS